MSSKGPHTRGRGGGKLDESTGTRSWRDVASLAPEPSTQWQAGTNECPKGYNADACVNRACGPILVRTPNVLVAGTRPGSDLSYKASIRELVGDIRLSGWRTLDLRDVVSGEAEGRLRRVCCV